MKLARLAAPTNAMVMVTLSLGIGANTAVFSVMNALRLRAAPYPGAERVALLQVDNRRERIRDELMSYPNYADYAQRNRVFEKLAAFQAYDANLAGVDTPVRLRGAAVTADFFAVLGVAPALGRVFTAEEDQFGRNNVVILSDGLWRERFGGEREVLGRILRLGGRPVEVAGVMPPGFDFPRDAVFWLPLAVSPARRATRNTPYLSAIGRLRPGITMPQAQADVETVAARLEQEHPQANSGFGATLRPLPQYLEAGYGAPVRTLLGAAALVLLIACVNVANLLLARNTARRKEIAIRSALGAGRGRLAGRLLGESALLATAGSAAGVALAAWGVRALAALAPAGLPRASEMPIDLRVLAFTVTACLAAAALSGVAPALLGARFNLAAVMKEGTRASADRGRNRLRRLLVSAEIAVSLVLLAGAGLLLRSFEKLLDVDPGFAAQRVLTMEFFLPSASHPDGAPVANYFTRLLAEVRAVPGVASAGAASSLMLDRVANTSWLTVEGRVTGDPRDRATSVYDAVSPGFFETLGIAALRGRLFHEQDGFGDARVILINEAFERRYLGGRDPVGRRAKFLGPADPPPWLTIVGVVPDTRRSGLDREARPEVYLPHVQLASRRMVLAVRAAGGDPQALIPATRAVAARVDPDVPPFNVATTAQLLDTRLAARRFQMVLLTAFAAVALGMAVAGIYGVMAQAVAQRMQEMGVRMALGARRGEVLRLVLGEGLSLAAAGVVIGWLLALALRQAIAGMLFAVDPGDPATFAAAAGILLLTALAACYGPARRASRVDPLIALRQE
jgi:putative ABC transport system permease protein